MRETLPASERECVCVKVSERAHQSANEDNFKRQRT